MGCSMKRIIAALIVGIIGAQIGGFLGRITSYLTDNPSAAEYMARFSFPTGAITGFLVCFFLAIKYLKFMAKKNWQSGVGFGPLFGGLSGAISGFITGLLRAVGESAYSHSDVLSFLFSGIFGAFVGAFFGIIAGFVIALIFGPFLLDKITRK